MSASAAHAATHAIAPARGGPRCGNRLLGALAAADWALIEPGAERVELERGAVLFEPGDDVGHAHFPCGGTVVSLVQAMADGRSVEAATVGREGALGGIISSGHKPAFSRGVVQIGGPALRVEAGRIEAAKARSSSFHDLFGRYADALLAQVLQSVACNALHPVEARCCRWLLTTQDRVGGNELPITQEFLAEMLGVQRTTVTAVARALMEQGIIRRYRRGRVVVADRAGLERAACECHGAVRRHFERVLPGLYPEWRGLGNEAGA